MGPRAVLPSNTRGAHETFHDWSTHTYVAAAVALALGVETTTLTLWRSGLIVPPAPKSGAHSTPGVWPPTSSSKKTGSQIDVWLREAARGYH
jgi:hypothetical protein